MISVIMCSIDAAKFAQASASYVRALATVPHEIIGIHDARSLAEGYNRAIARARGDLIVFSHDDVAILSPDFAPRMRGHLQDYDLIGIAGTTRVVGGGWYFAGHPFDFMLVVSPHPETARPTMVVGGAGPLVISGVQALDGVFMAIRADILRDLRFDEDTFDHFHLYDLDFSFRAFLAGHKIAVCRDLVLLHRSHGSYDDRWEDYRLRFERKFADKLAAPLPRRQTPIANVALDEAVLTDPIEVARLCSTATLRRFLAHVDRIVQ